MPQVGFEMAIFSFGSGFDLESSDPVFLATVRNFTTTAHAAGIEVGAYDLIAETRNPPQYDWRSIDADSGAPNGNACFASGWVDFLNDAVERFVNQTGFAAIETDGPFGGQPCASTAHAHHRDVNDSVYRQNHMQERFYKALRSRNLCASACPRKSGRASMHAYIPVAGGSRSESRQTVAQGGRLFFLAQMLPKVAISVFVASHAHAGTSTSRTTTSTTARASLAWGMHDENQQSLPPLGTTPLPPLRTRTSLPPLHLSTALAVGTTRTSTRCRAGRTCTCHAPACSTTRAARPSRR